MKYKALILLLILLTSSGCGSSNSTPSNKGENSKGIIKGTVTAASSVVFKGKPLLPKTAFAGNAGVAGAVCILEGTDNSVTTDASGFFQMSNVPAGSYILICKKTASEDGKVYAFLEIVEVQDGETVDLGTVDIKKTGGIQGKATLANLTDHTGISVYIPGTSMQARTDATGAYLINDVPEGTYELHFEKSGYMTGKITGLPVIAGETAIAEDMILNLSTGASGIISIENGKVYSNSGTVIVYITPSEDATLYQISDNPNFIGAVWNTIPPSRTWIFDSDGEKRLYAKFADANGLESAPVSDSIVIDTTPPVNGSISINNGASATNSTSVTLNLSATDATTSVSQMKISNTPDFAGAEWESFVTTRSWTIPAGDGTKTVYVQFRDIVGNETSQALSDDIILDTTLPVNPSISIQEGGYTNNPLIHLNLSALEATNMNISEDANFTSTQAIPYNSTMVFTLSTGEGNKTIYAKFIDEAGNETAHVSSSIILDTTPPTTPVIFNQNQTTNQTIFTMILSTPIADPNFKTYQLKGGQYADWTDTSEITTFSFTLTQAGENILSIRGKDLAGNNSNGASVSIMLDTIIPVLSSINVSDGVTTTAISWNTSELTTGKVDYGVNHNYGTLIEELNLATKHTVLLTGLSPQNLYHYRITSIDAAGNTTTSSDLTFATIKITAVTVGYGHTCVLTTSGGVKCWGDNYRGQIGDGTDGTIGNRFRDNPVYVVGLTSGITAVTAGSQHTCALTTSGGVKCWGDNTLGELGNGEVSERRLTPVDVTGLSSGITAVTAGYPHTCALTTSGSVICWGAASMVGSMLGGAKYGRTPVDVKELSSGITAIESGNLHTCSLTTTGGVKCQGYNRYGQRGDGTASYVGGQSDNTVSDVVGLPSGIIAISAGTFHTCALTTSGGVKCWGRNDNGQLGDGTTSDKYIPTDVVGLTSEVIAIDAREDYTCALTSIGGVKCWGGLMHTPVDVAGLPSGITAISGGCALTNSGGIKCWRQTTPADIEAPH